MELQILTAMLSRSACRGALLLLPFLLTACEKEITVDLPETASKVVVEGTIETGQPPVVLLSRTQSYFEPTSIAGLASLYITDGVVIVSDGFTTDTLDKVCSSATDRGPVYRRIGSNRDQYRPSAPDQHMRLDGPRWYDGRYGRTHLFAHVHQRTARR